MMLCVCLGIVEGAMLLLAGIFASIPFVSKLFRRRHKHSGSKESFMEYHRKRQAEEVAIERGNRPRPRYVTSTDLIKMEKRNKK